MILDFSKRKGFFMKSLMKYGKYIYRKDKDDYIKEDSQGRFHIKHLIGNTFELHYDINVDWKHFSINLPERCGKERKKLRKISYSLFPIEKEVYFKQKKSPQTYYDVLKSRNKLK